MTSIPGHRVERIASRLTQRKLWLTSSILGAVMLLTGSLASATIMVAKGFENTGTDNVIANASCDPLIMGPALTVQGCLNTEHFTLVNFSSDESIEFSGGQAKIVAADDVFSFLSISLATPNWTFNKLLLNIDVIENGSVTFTGLPGGESATLDLSKNGQNQFTITGEDFLSVAFVTTVGISSVDLVSGVRQVRIGGIKEGSDPDPDPVPEPGTVLLLGLGLAAMRLVREKA